MKIINHFLIIILTLSKIYGIELPVNSSDKITVSNWVIAKVEGWDKTQVNSFKNSPKEIFESII